MKIDTKETQDLIAAVKACIAVTTREMSPKLDVAGITDQDTRTANILQNVMRLCFEVGLNQSLGFTTALPMDMAVRLASYALSALPADMQDDAMQWVLETLPVIHKHRMQNGVGVQTQWVADVPETKQ